MALVMVVSMVAIGGIAAQPAAAQSSGFPSDADDLDDNELLVDDDFETGEVNDSDLVFEEIQAAVDEADSTNPGTTIYIRTGEYEESVLVDNEVDLVGQEDPVEDVEVMAEAGSPALELEADRVDVSDMTFYGNGASAVQLTSASSSENVKDLEFVDNTVVADDGEIGFESEPMDFGSPYSSPVNELTNNQFTVENGASADTLVYIGGAAAGTGSEQPGEDLAPGEVSFLIEDNEFATDLLTTPGDTGVSLHFEADQGVVTGNQFPADGGQEAPYEVIVAGDRNEFTANVMDSGGFSDGLVLASGSSDFLASQNTIQNADGDGVDVRSDTSNVEITENLISDNAGNGVLANGVTDLFVTNNDIENNDADGVSVNGSMNVTVASNTGIVGNGGTGVYAHESTNVLIEGNNVEENAVDGIWAEETEETQVLENYVRESGYGHGIHAQATMGQLQIGSNTVEDHNLASMADPVGILVHNVETGMVVDNEVVSNTEGIRVDTDTSGTVGVERNLVDDYSAGIVFENYNQSSPPYATYNALVDDGDDIRNNVDDTVEGILNYYGTGPDASDLHDISDLAQFDGDVIYDPFLSENPIASTSGNGVTTSGDVDVAGSDNTQEFAHELTLEGDGDGTASDALVIAFPAPVDGTVGEVFSGLPSGTQVMAYNATADEFVQSGSISDQPVGALDAFIVTGLEDGEEGTVAFEYDNDLAPQGESLEEGWNLVGAPQKNTVSTAFSGTISSENSQVNGPIRDASDMPRFVDDATADYKGEDLWFESTEDASGDDFSTVIGSDLQDSDAIVSPYTGYWILVDSDDTGDAYIGAATSAGSSAATEVGNIQTAKTTTQLV